MYILSLVSGKAVGVWWLKPTINRTVIKRTTNKAPKSRKIDGILLKKRRETNKD